MTQYVELHAHSNFSLLDGASSVEHLVEAARRAGMPAIALTDHDGLYAAPAVLQGGKGGGHQARHRCGAHAGGRLSRNAPRKDRAGYTNLSRLITKAQLAGSKGEPQLTFA